jgi:hypothetical protein
MEERWQKNQTNEPISLKAADLVLEIKVLCIKV